VRRGHRVRVADSLITGNGAISPTFPRRFFSKAISPTCGASGRRRDGLRAAPGGDPLGAALGERPDCVQPANIDASLNVLVAARDAGVKRLVYAGSSSAYGNTPTLPKREDMRPTRCRLRAAEARAEQYGRMFTSLYGFEVVTIRYFNVFGRARIRARRTQASFRFSRRRFSTGASRFIYGDASRRATSLTSPTS